MNTPMHTAELPVTTRDVVDAAVRLHAHVPPTPSARSATLSAITGADVVVKFENLQFTGSFKERARATAWSCSTPTNVPGACSRCRPATTRSAGARTRG